MRRPIHLSINRSTNLNAFFLTAGMRELGLVLRHVVAALHDQALAVEEPDLVAALLHRDARLAVDGVRAEVGDPDGRLPGTQEEEGLGSWVLDGVGWLVGFGRSIGWPVDRSIGSLLGLVRQARISIHNHKETAHAPGPPATCRPRAGAWRPSAPPGPPRQSLVCLIYVLPAL